MTLIFYVGYTLFCWVVDIKMAEGQAQVDNPGRATTGTIRQVPGNLMSFLTSRIAEYLGNTEGISAEIHEAPGELAKLVLYGVKGTTCKYRESIILTYIGIQF